MESRKLKNPDSFRQLAVLLGQIAEYHSLVTLDNLTLQRWSDVMALMREVDDMADEQQLSHQDILNRLGNFEEFADSYPSLVPTPGNLDMHHRLHTTAEQILYTGDELSASNSLDEYILHRTHEAHYTAQLFEDSASDNVRVQPKMTHSFTPLVKTLGEAACFLDSAKDLPKDYRAGRTQLLPTRAHRTTLLRASAERALTAFPLFRHPRIQKQLGRAAVIHVARRF